jgi:hypothetical protein
MSERIYGWLLTLYPRRFRQEYGEAMRQVFRDRLKTENLLALWAEVLRDLAVSVPREHCRPRQPAATPTGFTLSEEAIQQLVKRSNDRPNLLGSAVTLMLGGVVGLLGHAQPWPLLSILVALLVIHLMLTIRKRMRRRQRWKDFEVTLETDRIIVKQSGATRTLLKSDIKRLMEMPGFGLLIEPRGPNGQVLLPRLLTGYPEVRETLLTWAPVETPPDFDRRHAWLFKYVRGNFFSTAYVLALLVRSPYYLYPLTGIASLPLAISLLKMVRREAPFKIHVALLLPLLVNAAFALWR